MALASEQATALRSPIPIPVLIVDDSAVARAVLARVIEQSARFSVAGAVGDAPAALRFLAEQRVGIVLLDIEMPGVSGLTALPDILQAGAGARVLVVSSCAGEGAAASLQALALGAADTLVKPAAGAFAGSFAANLAERLERLADDARTAPPGPATQPAEPRAIAVDPGVIAIGASTGGIHALSSFLRALSPACTAPILITQHLPASFMPYFAAQTALLSGRPCDVATERMRVRPGRIVIAPGDAHLRAVRMSDGAALRLTEERVASGCRPSADPMFASVAAVWGERALAVVLSGMGRDGCEGARAIAAAGGTIMVQDEASSTIWGMPGAVAAAGIADAVLPPEAIARSIACSGVRR